MQHGDPWQEMHDQRLPDHCEAYITANLEALSHAAIFIWLTSLPLSRRAAQRPAAAA